MRAMHNRVRDILTSDARTLKRRLARYCEPDHTRSIVEIAITIVPFILLWLLMWTTLRIGYWLPLLLAVPASGFLVRLFMIQHDCGHGTLFRHRLANDNSVCRTTRTQTGCCAATTAARILQTQ